MIVEVMGRDAGWIALHAGIAGGAHIILLPEIPFTIESVCSFIGQRHIFGKKFTIISLAEGVQVPEQIRKDCIQRYGSIPKGISVGNLIGEAIADCCQEGSPGHRPGPHPARRLALALRPHPQHPLRRRRRRPHRPARLPENGGPARRQDRVRRYRRGHRQNEVRRSQRRTGQHRPLRRNSLRRRVTTLKLPAHICRGQQMWAGSRASHCLPSHCLPSRAFRPERYFYANP